MWGYFLTTKKKEKEGTTFEGGKKIETRRGGGLTLSRIVPSGKKRNREREKQGCWKSHWGEKGE